MARYVGAIDQGTTSTRFMVFDRGGNMITSAQKEHQQIFPKPGWVEHDPIEIWQNTQEVAGAALARAGLGPSDLAAVGITNQRETTILWNQRSGKPLHNALVWQDTRVDQLVAQYARNGGANRLAKVTVRPQVSPVDPGVPPQLMPIHRPVPRQRPEHEQPGRIHAPSKTRLLKLD